MRLHVGVGVTLSAFPGRFHLGRVGHRQETVEGQPSLAPAVPGKKDVAHPRNGEGESHARRGDRDVPSRGGAGSVKINLKIRSKECKGVHRVDLGESFLIPTSIYLMKSASIQPRTISSKFYSKLI